MPTLSYLLNRSVRNWYADWLSSTVLPGWGLKLSRRRRRRRRRRVFQPT